jgi:hypothetical protein
MLISRGRRQWGAWAITGPLDNLGIRRVWHLVPRVKESVHGGKIRNEKGLEPPGPAPPWTAREEADDDEIISPESLFGMN